MTDQDTTASLPSSEDTSTEHIVQPRRNTAHGRLTVSAAIALMTISALHTAVFAFHSWWGDWLAGPFRTTRLPMDAVVQFWGLPGGFVVPGVVVSNAAGSARIPTHAPPATGR